MLFMRIESRLALLVICSAGSFTLFSQESSDRQSLEVVRAHFGNDVLVQRQSRGRFVGAAALISYLSNVEGMNIPEGTEFTEVLNRIDAVKTAELKTTFGCEGEPSDNDTDEIFERKEVIDLLVGFGIKNYINRTIRTLADRNRTLNILKDELAQGNDVAARQANLNELQRLRATARNLEQTIESKVLAALPEVLQQVPEADAEDVKKELYEQSGFLCDALKAILTGV